MLQRQDLINCSIIFAYCVFFIALRLILPHSLSNDEAEQVFAASDYVWGYAKQPPLYSWILKTLSYFVELNVISLTVVKYCLTFVFITSFYYCNRILLAPSQAFIATSSLLYFITYSYDFNRDLTHTILLAVMAVLSYQQYLYLLNKPKVIHYLLLGLFFGLGILTKYNFLFIALAIVLAALSNKIGRERLFNFRTFISLTLALLISLPHLLWLLKTKAQALSYALNRADIEKDFSLLISIKSLFFAYYEIAIVLVILLLLWFALIEKQNTNDPIKNNMIQISLYAVLLPAITILFLGLNSFFAKWLSPVMFTLVPIFFSLVNFNKSEKLFKTRTTVHYILVSSIILVITAVNIIGGFAPDLIGRIRTSQYPYEAVNQGLLEQLKNRNIDPNNVILITSKDHLLLGNMQYIVKHSAYPMPVIKLKNYQNTQATKILIWNQSQNSMPKAFSKRFPQVIQQKSIIVPYINSHNPDNFYQLGWAIVD